MIEPYPPARHWAHHHIADSQTCPVCFAPVAKQHTRENRGVMLATYVCGNEPAHLWDVRWGLAQVGQ